MEKEDLLNEDYENDELLDDEDEEEETDEVKFSKIVKDFEEKHKKDKTINQDEFEEATSFLDITPEAYDKIYKQFLSKGYKLESDTYAEEEDFPKDEDINMLIDEEDENIEVLKLLLPLVLETELHPVILENLGDEEEENER